MSRIGKRPIQIPEKVTLEATGGVLKVKGPKGELTEQLHEGVMVKVENNQAMVSVKHPDTKQGKSLWGTYASHIKNMFRGVTEGFEKKLDIKGVGYGWQVSGKKITVKAGYSHTIDVMLPEGLTAKAEDQTLIISGISKQMVGEFAANVRKIRTPEPYKGTGIRYSDEHIRTKAGKQAAGTE